MTRSDITWIFIYFEVASSVCWFHPNFGLFLTDHYIKNIFSRPCCQSNNGYLIWPLDPEHTMSSDPPFSLSFIHHKNMAVLTNICLWLADWLVSIYINFFKYYSTRMLLVTPVNISQKIPCLSQLGDQKNHRKFLGIRWWECMVTTSRNHGVFLRGLMVVELEI